MKVTYPVPSRPKAMDLKEDGRIALLRDFDLDLIQPVAKSIRLNGKSTCIRLELAYWRILELLADQEGVPVNRLLSLLDLDVQYQPGVVTNFSALVRVVGVSHVLRERGVVL